MNQPTSNGRNRTVLVIGSLLAIVVIGIVVVELLGDMGSIQDSGLKGLALLLGGALVGTRIPR